MKASCFTARPPLPDQVPTIDAAITNMLAASSNARGLYFNPVFLVSKSATESRFVLDCAALSPYLQAPQFRLTPLPQAIKVNPVPPQANMVKLDIAVAVT